MRTLRDALDLLHPKSEYVATGTYYLERPDGPEIAGVQFDYDYVDPRSNTYRRLYSNIQGTDSITAIRTDDYLKFKERGYVQTQDGNWWQILQVNEDFSTAPQQAMRIFPVPVGVTRVLRLVQISNPWSEE